MAARLLSRSKPLSVALARFHASRTTSSSAAAAAAAAFSDGALLSSPSPAPVNPHLPSAGFSKVLRFDRRFGQNSDLSFSRLFSTKADSRLEMIQSQNAKAPECHKPIVGMGHPDPLNVNAASSKVTAPSAAEATVVKERKSVLRDESSKVKRMELANTYTYLVIPALLLSSSNDLPTALMIACIYCQIYWFYKEIFLDYVHHEISRAWVLIYFKLLLLFLAKDTMLYMNLF